MTTITIPFRLNPSTQCEQFFSTVSSLLSSITESTESAFRRVHVSKKDENGNVKLYDLKETVTDAFGRQVIATRKIDTLTYIEDIKTGDMYLAESQYVVSFKCALVALGIPFYAASKMAWQAVKTPLKVGAIALEMMAKIGQCKDTLLEIKNSFSRISETLSAGIFEIVKAPLFALGCELAAIYGIFRPYHGRKFEAHIEHAWLRGASHKEDFRNVPARLGEDCWTAFQKDLLDCHPFYLAHCFQVRGNVSDSRIIVKGRDPLQGWLVP